MQIESIKLTYAQHTVKKHLRARVCAAIVQNRAMLAGLTASMASI
jgi:hypothetical protein